MVDISGLDKLELFRRLCNNELPYIDNFFIRIFDEDEAVIAILKYIHRFRGRPIGCNLSNNFVSTTYYNRYYGENAFESIVIKMRNDLM